MTTELDIGELTWDQLGANHRSLVKMSDVTEETVDWLWYPYIPFKKLTVVDGDPGMGKSTALLAIAAELSRGGQLPEGQVLQPGNTLILCNEDGAGDTIKPRLSKMGADQARIYLFKNHLNLDGLENSELRESISKSTPSLLIIDPIQAFLAAGVDMNRANHVRSILSALAKLAMEFGFALIIIRHLAKGDRGKALYQGMGSIDFVGAARSVLLVGADPENQEKRAVIPIKMNLEKKGDPQGFTISDGSFEWTGKSDLTEEKVSRRMAPTSQPIGDAENFLKEILEGGPVKSDEVYNSASAEGLTSRTLQRAKSALGVKSKKTKNEWYWELPKEPTNSRSPLFCRGNVGDLDLGERGGI